MAAETLPPPTYRLNPFDYIMSTKVTLQRHSQSRSGSALQLVRRREYGSFRSYVDGARHGHPVHQ